MTEPSSAALPDAAEALAWRGLGLDDCDGRPVGRVAGVYVDAEAGAPVWLAVALSAARRRLLLLLRRDGGKTVAVPLRECAAMPARAWTAQAAAALRAAPAVDPARPLLREHEAAICGHYGIGPSVGRHAELSDRAAGVVTAHPA